MVERNRLALPAATLGQVFNAVHCLHQRTGRNSGMLVAKVGKHHARLLDGILEPLGRGDGSGAGDWCKLGQSLDGRLGPVRAMHGRALGKLHKKVVFVVRLVVGMVHGAAHGRHAAALHSVKDVILVIFLELRVAVILKDAHAIAVPVALVAADARVELILY